MESELPRGLFACKCQLVLEQGRGWQKQLHWYTDIVLKQEYNQVKYANVGYVNQSEHSINPYDWEQ